ncbi:transmembrane protease serine 13-like isoform X2 [Dermacentor albipictus]|uniref:transmembrane protease serine 13-like isoform X2 n=1 Tax=Dermacentor albipictus TaxID=60249 RepID=UPI0038FD23EF
MRTLPQAVLPVRHCGYSTKFLTGIRTDTSKQKWTSDSDLVAKTPASQASHAKPSQAQPSPAQPSQAKPSQAKPSPAKPSQAKASQGKSSPAKSRQAEPIQAQPSQPALFFPLATWVHDQKVKPGRQHPGGSYRSQSSKLPA